MHILVSCNSHLIERNNLKGFSTVFIDYVRNPADQIGSLPKKKKALLPKDKSEWLKVMKLAKLENSKDSSSNTEESKS